MSRLACIERRPCAFRRLRGDDECLTIVAIEENCRARLMCLVSLAGAALAFLASGLEWGRALVNLRSVPNLEPVGVAFRVVGGGVLVFGSVSGLYAIGLPTKERHALP